jgi:hypothetical protein
VRDLTPLRWGFLLRTLLASPSMAAMMKMRVRIPKEALTLTSAAIGGTGIFLLVLSVFHGLPMFFYGLLLVGCATVIVRSLPRRG